MAELQEIPQKLVLSRDEGVVKKRTKRPIASLPVLEHAKLPPQALDLEEAVLGALMLEKDALNAVIDADDDTVANAAEVVGLSLDTVTDGNRGAVLVNL